MNRVSIALGVSLLLVPVLTVNAQERERWDQLGSARVSFSSETDVIRVPKREGRFNAIRFQSDNGVVEVFNVRVHFANGEDFAPPTRVEFQPGQQSRAIDLPGDDRTIESITFRYRSRMPRGNAVVRVFGRHAGNPGSPDHHGEGVGSNVREGWTHIGAREVDARVDHDVISAEEAGTFRSIMITVEGADVDMFDIRVKFNNGESFSPDTRVRFEENSRSRVIDLPGKVRTIERIEFGYRTLKQEGGGKATVHVYGRK
jgi:hypothetical protein